MSHSLTKIVVLLHWISGVTDPNGQTGVEPLDRQALVIIVKHFLHYTIMAKTDYSVIDQMFAAVLSQNENEATIKALRPQVEEAVKALIAERGLPKTFTGTIEYHGFQIVVSRPRSYTWEQNTNPAVTSDPNHAIYLQQLDLQRCINDQLKDMRADVKRTAEKLAAAHPDSDSIKRGFRLAFLG